MVSNDVMRLEVKRLRDTLNGAADEVFSLENRRQQLAMSMKERKAEIQVKKEAFKLVNQPIVLPTVSVRRKSACVETLWVHKARLQLKIAVRQGRPRIRLEYLRISPRLFRWGLHHERLP